MPAAREEARERRLDGCGFEVERRDVPVEVIDGDERQAARPRERLRGRDADEERADEPRALRDRDALDRSSGASRDASASRTTGATSSRWRREATSGTTPPNRAWSSACDETTDESTRRRP